MNIVRILLIVVVFLLLFGGLGGHFGLWGVGSSPYTPFYGPSIGIGTLLLFILILWLIW
jgi:hypothetical protein